MSEDKSLLRIKRAVKIMGVILVVGFIGLIILVVNKLSSSPFSEKKVLSHGCTYHGAGVTVKSSVTSAVTEGHMLTLLTAPANGLQEVLVIDLCSGQTVSTVTINDVNNVGSQQFE